MEAHNPYGGTLSGTMVADGVSLQQSVYVQEYKYKEHVKKLDEKWIAMKQELEKLSKGRIVCELS
jgi:hypothetical protein